jgi:hypothetical protein
VWIEAEKTMARAAATTKPTETVTQPHEVVDPAVYEGWDFDQLNREARELRRIARTKGYDATLSTSRGRAAAVASRRSA